MKAGVVYHSISPEGGKFCSNEGTTTWEYSDYKPGTPFRVIYYILALPRTAADCDSWVHRLLCGKSTKDNRANVAEMREVVAAFYGIAPRSDSAKRFVERQVWYHPKKGFGEAGLTAEQKAVLARLDAIAAGK